MMLPKTLLVIVLGLLVPSIVAQTHITDILDTAIENGNFRYLVTCIRAAFLDGALQNGGPFTVFAPTDTAFAKLPIDVLNYLLAPQNRRVLVRVLLYHIIPINVTAAAIKALNPPVKIQTLNEQSFLVTEYDDELHVNDARVLITDIFSTNGIIHAIDTVLIPPKEDLVDTIIHDSSYQILVKCLQAADLVDTLKGSGPFTIFAPTDYGFNKLPAGTIANLLKPENKQLLTEILLYHVVAGNLTDAAIINLHPPVKLETLAKQPISITLYFNEIKINNATVVAANSFATNGIIHTIDQVLLPPQLNALRLHQMVSLKH
jgi:transforming growth factor-beta-induced protein